MKSLDSSVLDVENVQFMICSIHILYTAHPRAQALWSFLYTICVEMNISPIAHSFLFSRVIILVFLSRFYFIQRSFIYNKIYASKLQIRMLPV